MIQKNNRSLFTIILLFLASALYSQITIQGIITDVSDNPVSGALVEIINEQDTLQVQSSYTDNDGLYIITTSPSALQEQTPHISFDVVN